MKAHSSRWQNRVVKFLSRKSLNLGLAVVAAIASPTFAVSVVRAQQALPPPPSISDTNALPSLAPVPPPTSGLPMAAPTAFPSAGFNYPQDASGYPAPMPVPGAYSASSYQVIVNGDSPYLLQQIQLSDQAAYVREYQGRRVIQAGEFQTEGDAQNRVMALAQQGVAAQVVSANASFGQGTGMNSLGATPSIAKVSHYQVVVPTRPEMFATLANKMVGMGVRPDAIQAKRAPLGPHLAIGPFLDQKEAESVSQYLRTGGMDARVFFVR
ncbi:MAG: hypothetical protein IGS48_18535 [Oscillatoriales cyanobacterium C42_A2020_001]|nr:hypothetical protein [Leptolyngbyaceae cyanobacterium C42_A2020_001]